ncbi:hypothetical protein F511_44112 [Dorcoceras hygrometricum]|uniref:UBN2 domain-containing protein n=1 Tax=Dorcoceras hygrometricum TaxID=472368 RepID=A0A2Z6ZY69_9LAMI|nr:hypothetical protein F511_44112 [Dorcoceras hygrometricum]
MQKGQGDLGKADHYEGNEQTKENKLIAAIQKFDLIKMKLGETMAEFDERFISILSNLKLLGKSTPNIEVALKMMRALLKEWDVKTMA